MKRFLFWSTALLLLAACSRTAAAQGLDLRDLPNRGVICFAQLPDGTYAACQLDGDGNLKTTGAGGESSDASPVKGSATSTDTSAHTLLSAAGSGIKNYIRSMQCARTDAGTSSVVLTLNDTASSTIVLPPGGGNNPVFSAPLSTAANTAFQFTAGAATTTIYCNAQGYTGP